MINFDKLQELSKLRYDAVMAVGIKYPGVKMIYSTGPVYRYTEPLLPEEEIQDMCDMWSHAGKLQELETQELNSLRVRQMYHDSVTDVLLFHPDKIELLQGLIERWLF